MKLTKNILKLLFIVLIVFNISCSEDKTIELDKLQVRGELVYEINNETPFSGTVLEKYDNDQIKEKSSYSEGIRDGLRVRYYDTGQKKAEGNYTEGLRDGHLITWYRNGQKETEGDFVNEQLSGLFIQWNDNGQKISKTNYEKGRKDGEEITYYVNGQKKQKANYKDDILEGELIFWYDNGQQSEKGLYKEGKKVDEWLTWDFDGNKTATYVYFNSDEKIIKAVKIGLQIWQMKNLNVSEFRNGNIIPQARTRKAWNNAGKNKQPAWCYYKNRTKYGKKYGKLYNWYAINDPRGLSPEGWHIPSLKEFEELKTTADGDAGKLLATNQKIDGNGYIPTNHTGFTAWFAGERGKYVFSNLGGSLYFWTTTENDRDTNLAYAMSLSGQGCNATHWIGDPLIYFDENYNKARGYSVRCLKD